MKKFYIGTSFKNSDVVNYFSKELEKYGWKHTYNWAENIKERETEEDMIKNSILEENGINESEVVIIILPGGRGTHIELGIAVALNKKIYLCSENKDDFSIENTVPFYESQKIKKIYGTKDEIIKKIIEIA